MPRGKPIKRKVWSGDKFWLKSPHYQSYRRPQRLGSLAKWRLANPEEAARVQAKYERERKAA